eukprot:TRINITY_DN3782_c0_g1_i2.p1 TRINITY_DN3782_c0_g1~~TRINITY_DN3782_c0_g1_i2.p1  ORF type:complete len:677 (+),score=86.87 TRINITY_DN3782_c0_g1_i2:85-2031(+)
MNNLTYSSLKGSIESLKYFDCLDRDFVISDRSLDMVRTKWCEVTEVTINGTVEDSTVGMCVPKNQPHYLIAEGYWEAYRNTSVQVACSDDRWLEWTPAAIIAFVIITFLVIMPVIAWMYSMYADIKRIDLKANPSVGLKLFLSFNIKATVSELISVRAGSGTEFLDAFRVLSMLWIIMGHCEAIFGRVYKNSDYWEHQTIAKDAVLYSSYVMSVNTFFWTGAYLGAGGMLKKLAAPGAPKRSECGSVVRLVTKGYLLRYLRVVPMMAYCIVVGWVIIPRLGTGLQWKEYYSVMTLGKNYDCLRYWWTNLLFINTYKMGFCLPWTWYITTDFHFFLLLPFLVLPFIYFGRSCGIAVNVIALAVTLTFVAVQESYVKANSRGAPFVIGVLCAFFMAHLTKKTEEEKISKKQVEVVTNQTPLAAEVELVTVQNCSFSYVEPPTGEEEETGCCSDVSISKSLCDTPWVRNTFYTVSAVSLISVMFDFHVARTSTELPLQLRLVKEIFWAVGITCISIPFILGHGGLVKRALSLPVWTVLGKLTFGAYLVHPVLIVTFACSAEKMIYARSTSYLLWLGVTFLAYVCSFFMWCMIECPFSKIVFLISNKVNFRAGAIASAVFFSLLLLYGVLVSEHVSDPLPMRVDVFHPPLGD